MDQQSASLSMDRGNQVALKIIQLTLRSQRVAHAYLFKGPSGSPKVAYAVALAKGLLCDNQQSETGRDGPCESCWSCREIGKGAHPDLFQVEKDGNTIKIKKTHEILKEALSRPYHSTRKVFVIREAEDMTAEASNALLKILEEPPSYVTFILTATNVAAIPETIVSRCQVVPFRRLPPHALGQILVEEHKIPQEEALAVAEYSDGSVDKALSLLEGQRGGSLGESVLRELTEISPVEVAQKYSRLDPKERLRVVFGLEVLFQKKMRESVSAGFESDVDRDQRRYLEELQGWYRALDSLLQARRRLDANTNPFLALAVLFMDLCHIEKGWRLCLP